MYSATKLLHNLHNCTKLLKLGSALLPQQASWPRSCAPLTTSQSSSTSGRATPPGGTTDQNMIGDRAPNSTLLQETNSTTPCHKGSYLMNPEALNKSHAQLTSYQLKRNQAQTSITHTWMQPSTAAAAHIRFCSAMHSSCGKAPTPVSSWLVALLLSCTKATYKLPALHRRPPMYYSNCLISPTCTPTLPGTWSAGHKRDMQARASQGPHKTHNSSKAQLKMLAPARPNRNCAPAPMDVCAAADVW